MTFGLLHNASSGPSSYIDLTFHDVRMSPFPPFSGITGPVQRLITTWYSTSHPMPRTLSQPHAPARAFLENAVPGFRAVIAYVVRCHIES